MITANFNILNWDIYPLRMIVMMNDLISYLLINDYVDTYFLVVRIKKELIMDKRVFPIITFEPEVSSSFQVTWLGEDFCCDTYPLLSYVPG